MTYEHRERYSIAAATCEQIRSFARIAGRVRRMKRSSEPSCMYSINTSGLLVSTEASTKPTSETTFGCVNCARIAASCIKSSERPGPSSTVFAATIVAGVFFPAYL